MNHQLNQSVLLKKIYLASNGGLGNKSKIFKNYINFTKYCLNDSLNIPCFLTEL